MALRFSTKMKIKIKNYNIPIFIYFKIAKKKFNTNLLIVCFYHVTYEFESESTLYSCLNVTLYRCTLKLVRDMIKTYNQMHRTDKYLQHSSIIWPVWLNG